MISLNKTNVELDAPKITIIGTGYVGLVTGACLAELGNTVLCADVNEEKIRLLQDGKIPIYEPGLENIVHTNVQASRLEFTNNVQHAIRSANILFVAIGTPADQHGSPDLSALHQVIDLIAQNLNDYKIIVIKSTVPIGTCSFIHEQLINHYGISEAEFDILHNPEFLREGKAIQDFMHPDRIVIGGQEKTFPVMQRIYQPLIKQNVPMVLTDCSTAEAIKYASNCFLGLKVSFINEIANLCDKVGIDAHTVAHAIGLDQRIGPHFLQPGPGFGGSCFPKDIQGLLQTAQQYNVPLHTVQTTLTVNAIQRRKVVEKLLKLMNNQVRGKTIAVLGLAFKANTDDVRESPAITTIELLLQNDCSIKAYDPVAMNNMKHIFPTITYCKSMYEAVTGADALVIMTEWNEFKTLDLTRTHQLMRQSIIIDARNIFDPRKLIDAGFICDNIGTSYLCKTNHKDNTSPNKKSYNQALMSVANSP